MRTKKLTKNNMEKVFRCIQGLAHVEPTVGRRIFKEFNAVLDAIGDEDIFGTERQLDPRGDPRT